MVGKRYEVNDLVIKLKLHLKKREVCSRGKQTNIFTIKGNVIKRWPATLKQEQNKYLLFNWWARSTDFSNPVFWLSFNNGSVFRCFLGFLFFWRFTGNNHVTSAAKHRTVKRSMQGMTGSGWKKNRIKKVCNGVYIGTIKMPALL